MNKRLVGCLLLTFCAVSVRAGILNDGAIIFKDFAKFVTNVFNACISNGLAIIRKTPDLIPSPKDVLSMGYEVVVGLPTQIALQSFDAYCNIVLSGGSAKDQFTPEIENMGLHFMKETLSVTYPLNQPEKLLEDPNFDHDLPMVIFCTGFMTVALKNVPINRAKGETFNVLFRAYTARGGYNFVAFDSGGYVNTMYSWASLNTKGIGQFLAESLVKIVETYPLEKIQLIGHSLGAHIVGSAGYYFHKATGQFIPRITGLDPANPCFREGETLYGISRDVADFVDIIHTNNGVFGEMKPIGDVDFYPNGVVAIQPGCYGTKCSHMRAQDLYAETVYPGNENNFLATRCRSLKALKSNICKGRRIPMGFACPTNATGKYFLTTRKSFPFGENSGGY